MVGSRPALTTQTQKRAYDKQGVVLQILMKIRFIY